MKKIFLLLLLPAMLCADPISDAEKSLEKARFEYAQKHKSNAASIAAFAEEIALLKGEIAGLEKEFASVKNSSAESEDYSKILILKNGKFDSLRSDAEKFAGVLKSFGASNISGVSHDKEIFAENFLSLLISADAEIKNPAAIFDKIVVSDPLQAIENFNAGKDQIIEIDPTMGRLARARHENLRAHFNAGGLWMYPILAFGLFALGISCAKFYVFSKAKRLPSALVGEVLALLACGKNEEAIAFAKKSPYPYRDLIVSLIENKNIEKPLLEEMSYAYMLDVGERLHSGLGFLSVTAAVSPLLGLLGTVTGIIKTFGGLSMQGSGSPHLISEGISEALITTEFGLMVAIPSIVIHALLNRRAKAVLSDMEKLAAAFISKN